MISYDKNYGNESIMSENDPIALSDDDEVEESTDQIKDETIFESFRKEASEIVSSECIDKACALRIMNLVHTMDRMFMIAMNEKQKTIDGLQRELSLIHIKESTVAKFHKRETEMDLRLQNLETRLKMKR